MMVIEIVIEHILAISTCFSEFSVYAIVSILISKINQLLKSLYVTILNLTKFIVNTTNKYILKYIGLVSVNLVKLKITCLKELFYEGAVVHTYPFLRLARAQTPNDHAGLILFVIWATHAKSPRGPFYLTGGGFILWPVGLALSMPNRRMSTWTPSRKCRTAA